MRALKRADVPSTKEPAGLFRGDGKRPDGLILFPWQIGRSLTWDVAVVDTLANSHTPTTSVTPCGAAEAASTRKRAKCENVVNDFDLVDKYSAFLDLEGVHEGNLTFLGDPMLQGRATNKVLQENIADLERAIKRLTLLQAHDVLCLLKNSIAVPDCTC